MNYKNPILYADYSDPDVVRVGTDYYMVASSFCNVPAIPVLHSKDLVHWKVVNYVLKRIPFVPYDAPAHGKGVWAPAIRYNEGLFYVMFPMPDEGIFCCTAKDPLGAWSDPVTVRSGKGWIDPCPFWDDDGKAYMVSAFAKSRIGIKSILNLAPMKPDCTGLFDDGCHIFDGHDTQPTIEGPKMYKRNGYYYILAPAGGVKHGWQTALRARNIWGPYEEKIVMFRGGTQINGPHQGGLVDTPNGECWFIHFRDVGACGRIIYLQPVKWVNDWPLIGEDTGSEGCGQPVSVWQMPSVGAEYPPVYPADSDGFDDGVLGLQWQWNANPNQEWYSIHDSCLVLYAQPHHDAICDAPNLLLQKFMARGFNVTVKINTDNFAEDMRAGLAVLGNSYAALEFMKTGASIKIFSISGIRDGEEEKQLFTAIGVSGTFYLKLSVAPDMHYTFAYGIDEKNFIALPRTFEATAGAWVGAKFGIYAIGKAGSASFDSVEVCKRTLDIG